MQVASSIKYRLRAFGLHLCASAIAAGLSAALVFGVWYPPPYASIAGGLGLFLLLVGVDVVLGPALTAVAASPSKSSDALTRDICIIVLLQLVAFLYGLQVMAAARPVYLVFEVDRMRVVTAADIEPEALASAPLGLRSLPWGGPKLLAAVKPMEPEEQIRSVELGLAGVDLSMVPANWRTYASQKNEAWRRAIPVSILLAKYPAARPDVARLAARAEQPFESLRFLPLQSRQASWVTLIAGPDARVVGHLPFDGFF